MKLFKLCVNIIKLLYDLFLISFHSNEKLLVRIETHNFLNLIHFISFSGNRVIIKLEIPECKAIKSFPRFAVRD